VAIIIIAILMLLFVVPTLTETFKQLHVALPLPTKVFISISDFTVNHWITILMLCALLIGGTPLFARSSTGKRLLLTLGLRIPVLGELIKEVFAARTARALSSLLSAGVPVLEALEITKDVVGGHPFDETVASSVGAVKKGEPLSKSFAAAPSKYPVLFAEMMAVGEETGKVASMLKDVADYYENNVSTTTKDLSTIIEPLLMLLIGAVVGIFAFSMIAPIYSISSAI
jgi:type IV pilus assembly protein PilC